MIVELVPETLVIHKKFQDICIRPYPGHRKGCPNYGKKEGCPPNQPLIHEVFDFKKPAFVIYTDFEIGLHAAEMKRRHPAWTERQLYNCLYWQPRARKIHHAEEERALRSFMMERIERCPEAKGLNITETMRTLGVELEWPPRTITRIVSIGGSLKRT
jgi:hypothetical protein